MEGGGELAAAAAPLAGLAEVSTEDGPSAATIAGPVDEGGREMEGEGAGVGDEGGVSYVNGTET